MKQADNKINKLHAEFERVRESLEKYLS
jgi:hypothetical protein